MSARLPWACASLHVNKRKKRIVREKEKEEEKERDKELVRNEVRVFANKTKRKDQFWIMVPIKMKHFILKW